MQLQTAERKKVKLRLNIASPSGFGKTYSALLIAFGLAGDWEKIAVIDTENDSASLYSHLGKFKTLSLRPPYSPDRYINAIRICEEQNISVIVIDSISHIWKGPGGLLEYQNSLGGRYQDWAKTTPLYQKWLNAILYSNCHVITTNRKKQAFNMLTDGNKTKVEKAGLDDEIRTGYDYEMTLAFDIINDQHMAKASKDRTQLFVDKQEFVITIETGQEILNWCNLGQEEDREPSDLLSKIQSATSVEELIALYKSNPQYQEKLLSEFTKRRTQLQTPLFDQKTINTNGNI